MIGSLNKLWPWKVVTENYIDRHGAVVPLLEKNVLPSAFENATGSSAMVGWAATFMVAGIMIITVIEIIAGRLSKSN